MAVLNKIPTSFNTLQSLKTVLQCKTVNNILTGKICLYSFICNLKEMHAHILQSSVLPPAFFTIKTAFIYSSQWYSISFCSPIGQASTSQSSVMQNLDQLASSMCYATRIINPKKCCETVFERVSNSVKSISFGFFLF